MSSPLKLPDLKDVTCLPATRLDLAKQLLRRYLRPEGSTIHCMMEPTRSGTKTWVRIFTGGFIEKEEPWIIDLTTSVAELLNLTVQGKNSSREHWAQFRLESGSYKPLEVAKRIEEALHYPKGSIKARYL